jgi:hypothetical protein
MVRISYQIPFVILVIYGAWHHVGIKTDIDKIFPLLGGPVNFAAYVFPRYAAHEKRTKTPTTFLVTVCMVR